MKTKRTALQVRLSPDAARFVAGEAKLLGWSETKTASHFLTEVQGFFTGARTIGAAKALLESQEALTLTLNLNRRRELDARAKVRAARKNP